MFARRAKEDIIASKSGTGGQKARRGNLIAEGAKSDREAVACEKNESTALAVHRKSVPSKEGWRVVPPTLP